MKNDFSNFVNDFLIKNVAELLFLLSSVQFVGILILPRLSVKAGNAAEEKTFS